MIYRSKFEEKVARELVGISTYETLKLRYAVPAKVCTYTPDFILTNTIIIECKGRFTLEDRQKMILVRQSHPHLDIRLLFQNARVRLTKTSKTTYGMWATKNNFIWAEKSVPREWLEEKVQ